MRARGLAVQLYAAKQMLELWMHLKMKNGRTPFNPKEFADFRRAIRSGEFVGVPMDAGAELTQKQALTLAIHHIEHMAAWIAKQSAGYSFESLGEDMPGMKAALSFQEQRGVDNG